MYYVSNPYSYPYWVNPSTYSPNYMNRNHEDNVQPVFDVLLSGIKREAEAIELYRQLVHVAPNEMHQNDILYALERKKAQLTQFNNLYFQLTGTVPVYQLDQIHFDDYRDGLQKAYEAEVEGYEEYQKGFSTIQHPMIQNVFLWALTGEQENAASLRFLSEELAPRVTDFGGKPFVVDINKATKQNENFRTALWTGTHLQVTLMSINVGEDIGLEIHPHLDQFLRVEEGEGIVRMGAKKDQLDFEEKVADDFAIMIPAATWHNVINTGNTPLKLYSIYAPPQHPFGTIHKTKADAMAAEGDQ
ncbi:cupin domain-containing protein [Robertmurraya korlensis]|nr:cupin domain-containing protein [Robertmurraya korlensis]